MCEHCCVPDQQRHLLESLNTVLELSNHLLNQKLPRYIAPPSKSSTPILIRSSSHSPDNEHDQAGIGHANTDTLCCGHEESVSDVVKNYLELFPIVVFDVVKLTCFHHSLSAAWKGSDDVIEIFKVSCDLLKDIVSLTPPGQL